jgi:hypothetical protein
MGRNRILPLAFPLIFLFASALADHLPEPLLALGKPERTLAGIDIQNAKLADVVQRYGVATRKVNVPNNPDWTGYVWEKSAVKLEVGVQGSADLGVIESMYVEGTDRGLTASTGAGLRLGDSVEAIKKIYGTRFQEIKQSKIRQERREFMGIGQSHLIVLQWKSVEFTLMVGFNQDGKIAALMLMPPECYPGDCD